MGGGGGGWAGLTCRAPVPGGQGEGPRPDPDAQPPGPERPTEDDGEKGNRGIHGGCWQVGDPGEGGPTPCQCHTPSFQACSSPMGPASHPRSLGPWEVAQDSPAALAPARRHLALRGKATPASSLYYPEPWFPWCAGKAGRRWQSY